MTTRPKQARGPARWVKQNRFDIEFAKRMVLENGSCAPIMVLYRRLGRPPMVMTRNPDLGRETTALYLRAVATAEDAEAFAFISEAWMRRVERRHGETEDEYDARVRAVTPSQAEDRIEVVIAQLVYRGNSGVRRTLTESREIVRDAKGTATGFRSLGVDHGMETEGRWTDVIPPEPPSGEERTNAAAALRALADVGVGLAEAPLLNS